MSNPRTIARLEARIKERVAYAVEFELNDPRASFITVTRVELTKDLANARVFYSVLGTEADRRKVARMLEAASGFVQRQLGRVLRTRRIPRLEWRYDDSIETMANMGRTIDEALDADRSINPEAHGEIVRERETDASSQAEAEIEYEEYLDSDETEER